MKLPGKIYQCFELWIRERERERECARAIQGIGFVICGLEMDPGLYFFFFGSSSTRFETLATSPEPKTTSPLSRHPVLPSNP